MIESNKAIIIKMNNIQGKKKLAEKKFNLKNLISTIAERAKNEIKSEDYYRRIDVGSPNEDSKYYAKGIAFSIQRDSSMADKHMLSVSMLHPSMKKENSKPLVYGNKDEIVKFLTNENSIKQIEEKLQILSGELENS